MDFTNSIPFSVKNHQKKPPFGEAFLFFLVFFFPGYYYQTSQFSFGVMFSVDFHLLSLLFTLPQLILMLYILQLRTGGDSGRYGTFAFKSSILPKALVTFLGVFSITLTLGIIAQLFGTYTGISFINPAIPAGPSDGIDYSILRSSPFLPLCILGTSLIIGYFEELFFRVYLISEFSGSFLGTAGIVGISSLLFSAGHLYQGFIGALGTFLIGTFLAYRYIRGRNWHEIAIAHGVYNFLMLMLIPALNAAG